MFSPKENPIERGWPGRIEGDRVIQLAAQTLQAFFTGGGGAREHAEYALTEVDLRAPVMYPPTVRRFNGLTLDFEFANTSSMYGPEDEIPYPEGALERGLDCLRGVAGVIGKDGSIGGYTLANTFWAPDLPGVKSRDFALSIGPVVVTERDNWEVKESVVGSDVACATLPYEADWDAVVRHAARNTRLRPGDLLILDFGPCAEELRVGDVVELEADGIGILRNRIA